MLRSDYDRYGDSLGAQAVARMDELSTALGEWIAKGGFPPKDWQHTA